MLWFLAAYDYTTAGSYIEMRFVAVFSKEPTATALSQPCQLLHLASSSAVLPVSESLARSFSSLPVVRRIENCVGQHSYIGYLVSGASTAAEVCLGERGFCHAFAWSGQPS